MEVITVMYPLDDTGSISRSIGSCGGGYYCYVPFAGHTGSIGRSIRAEVGGAEVGDLCCGTLAILLGRLPNKDVMV